MTIEKIIQKYEFKADSLGRPRRPAGGNDVMVLCRKIAELEMLVRDIQTKCETDIQNEIERHLIRILLK